MFEHHRPPPEGWGVSIGHFERRDWRPEWVTRRFTVLSNEEYAAQRSPEVDFSNASSTTMVLNHLLIQVTQCPEPHFGHWFFFERPNGEGLSGKLRRVWPEVREAGVRWPPTAMTDADADAVANDVIARIKRIGEDLYRQKIESVA